MGFSETRGGWQGQKRTMDQAAQFEKRPETSGQTRWTAEREGRGAREKGGRKNGEGGRPYMVRNMAAWGLAALTWAGRQTARGRRRFPTRTRRWIVYSINKALYSYLLTNSN